jgi:plastocyanin
MTRTTRHVLSAVLGLTIAAASTVPVLAQSHSSQTSARTLRAVKVQANNFRFCKNSKATCSTTTDTNHATHVLVGQKIKWIYKDSACDNNYLCPGHNVTFAHRHSGDTMTEGAVIYTTVFKHTGTYSYYCTHHKTQGMTGRIIVTKN